MIKFGVAGNSKSFRDEGHSSTLEAAAWCNKRNIDAFEYSFGKGINMSDITAAQLGREFKNYGIENSVHAPYYINFANSDPNSIEKSISYVVRSLQKLKAFDNGDRVVVHPATQGKNERRAAVDLTKQNLEKLGEVIISEGYADYKICIETMGKLGQLGSLEEVIEFCSLTTFFYPCIDFGHLNARTRGSLKTEDDYSNIIRKMLDEMPENKVKNMHVHFSKIMYGTSGEIKHLTFEDDIYGPEFAPLSETLIKYDITPYIICESSGTQAEDAVKMRAIYNEIKNK